jgi:hypothetical protein
MIVKNILRFKNSAAIVVVSLLGLGLGMVSYAGTDTPSYVKLATQQLANSQ